jgi:hypothetical protein
MHSWRSIFVLSALAAVACQGSEILSPQQGGILINKTTAGMTKDEIIGQLGLPHKQETYGATEFLFYNTNWVMADAATQRSPVVIVRGKVVGFGKGYYETFLKAQNDWKSDISVGQPEWNVAITQ